MGARRTGRRLAAKAGLAVVAVGVMLAGSYALVGQGDDFALGEGGATIPAGKKQASVLEGTVVTHVANAASLDPGVMVVTVPLGVNFAVPGRLYGDRAKSSVQLGPKGIKGMTQDGFGTQAATLLPDGQRLLYHFWQELTEFPTYAPSEPQVPDGTHMATPSIRVLDLASGQDALVESGARSMAWSATDELAYAKGIDDDYRLNVPYLQRVEVRKGLDGEPQVWTTDADRYTVWGWLGDSLLVWRELLGGARELLVFDGPDSYRRLVNEVDGEVFLAASPDGERILTASGGLADDDPVLVNVVNVSDGGVVATLSFQGVLDPATGEPVGLPRQAAWEADRVVVAMDSANLAIITVAVDALELNDIVALRYPKLGRGPLNEPLLDATGAKLYVVADEGDDTSSRLDRTAVITYDLASGECRRWIVPGTPAITHLVSSTSRPR